MAMEPLSGRPGGFQYAVKNPFSPNYNLNPWLTPERALRGESWKSFGRLDVTAAYERFYQIQNFLSDYAANKIDDQEERSRIATLFIGDEEEDLFNSTAFQEVRKSVQETGLLIIDAEFASAQYLESRGCCDPVSSGMDLFQFGSVSGHACFIQVQYDCSKLHLCKCEQPCNGTNCTKEPLKHRAWEFRDDFQNNGVKIPDEVVSWLKDDSIIKIQMYNRNNESKIGVLERLEIMLGMNLKTFVELRNLNYLWFNEISTMCKVKGCQQEGKDFVDRDQYADHMYFIHDKDSNMEGWGRSGLGLLAKELEIMPGLEFFEKNTGRPLWQANRRKPFTCWSVPLKYHDISTVLVPAAFLLKVGIDIINWETATCLSTNIYPYLRQMLLVLKNEPCLIGPKPGTLQGRERSMKAWLGVQHLNVGVGHANQMPWRPGYKWQRPAGKKVVMKVKGEIISRNLRQLAAEICNDAYCYGNDPEDLGIRYKPKEHCKSFIEQAKECWNLVSIKPERSSELSDNSSKDVSKLFNVNTRKRLRESENEVNDSKMANCSIPNHKLQSPNLYGRCLNCGSSMHESSNCTGNPQCLYPLCHFPSPPHATAVCSVLHSICPACKLRGHCIKDHGSMDIVTLIKIAEAWAPQGVFTSLPILGLDEQFWRQPSEEEYTYNVYNKSKKTKIYEKSRMTKIIKSEERYTEDWN